MIKIVIIFLASVSLGKMLNMNFHYKNTMQTASKNIYSFTSRYTEMRVKKFHGSNVTRHTHTHTHTPYTHTPPPTHTHTHTQTNYVYLYAHL